MPVCTEAVYSSRPTISINLLKLLTQTGSERHLRPSVIFRKVTNGFRCEWGAQTYAAFRSVVSTAKANRASVLDTVRFLISTKRSGETLAGAG